MLNLYLYYVLLGVASLPFTRIINEQRHSCLAKRFYQLFHTDSQFGGSSFDDTDTSGGEDEADTEEEQAVSRLLEAPTSTQFQVCRSLAEFTNC